MLSKIKTVSISGIVGREVLVEVDVGAGLPSFTIVGLPAESIEESRERTRAAIKNAGYDFPIKKIVVNLAPADVKKEGTYFEFANCSCYSFSDWAIRDKNALNDFYFIGELSLDGSVRKIAGALPMIAGLKKGAKVIAPFDLVYEISIVEDVDVYFVKHIKEVVEFFNGDRVIEPVKKILMNF